MKIVKVILFVCSFFLIGAFYVSAAVSVTDSATVDIILDPLAIVPDLKATVHHDYVWVDNSDGPIYVSYDVYSTDVYDYTLNWAAVLNATSCTLDGNPVSVAGGEVTKILDVKKPAPTHTLTCQAAGFTPGSNSVELKYPPAVTNLKYTCNASNTSANFTWNKPAGIDAYYVRASSQKGGYSVDPNNDNTVVYNDNWSTNSYNIAVNPSEKYSFWVNSKAQNGAFAPETAIDVSCVPQIIDPIWSGWSLNTNCTPECESSCDQIWTRSCTQGACIGPTSEPRTIYGGKCPFIKFTKPVVETSKILYGKTIQIAWESYGMKTCLGTSTDPLHLSWNALKDGLLGEFISSKLLKTTTYRINCKDIYDKNHAEVKRIINVEKPTLEEI